MRQWGWVALTLGVIAALGITIRWVYAPLRARRLARRYERFRADFQARHDEIDAAFHHRDIVVDGLTWHFVEEGDPHGESILFLHGLPEGWYSWHRVLPRVDHKYRLIVVDMKGYGRSDRSDPDYNWHSVAAQTAALMESLGVQRYYVVGHDWGAIIGSVLVHDFPARILGFIRMEADLIPRAKSSRLATYLQKPQWLLFQVPGIGAFLMRDAAWWISFVYQKRMTTPFQPDDRDYLTYEYSRPNVADTVPRYFLRRNWDLDTAIRRACVCDYPFPLLQLQADSDPAQPRSLFADAATQCPRVRVQWISNASHFDNFDQPEQVADAINHFVRANSSRRPEGSPAN